jgi:carbon storage regulator CsrA
MLVLKRNVHERIVIRVNGVTDIIVELAAVQGQSARIGIEAPNTVRIWREEVVSQMDAMNGK